MLKGKLDTKIHYNWGVKKSEPDKNMINYWTIKQMTSNDIHHSQNMSNSTLNVWVESSFRTTNKTILFRGYLLPFLSQQSMVMNHLERKYRYLKHLHTLKL